MLNIPGYEIIRELGEGGMSVVYLCRHKVLDKLVAIKVLHDQLCRKEDIKERFINEARLMNKLEHPNIIRVIDFLEFSNRVGFIMEYVEGRSLDHIIGREVGPIPYEKALPLFEQVLAGVAYAHEKGVVHRDLKPSNVMVTDDGIAKITDFGIAKMLGEESHTKTGSKLGTLYYMSPEQIKNSKGVDRRTDIYSLGMTLYEMLAGRLPFDSTDESSEFDVMHTIINRNIPSPVEFYPHIPDWLVSITLKAAAIEQADRFDSCGEFLAALKQQSDQLLSFRDREVQENIDTSHKMVTKSGMSLRTKLVSGVVAFLSIAVLISILGKNGGSESNGADSERNSAIAPSATDSPCTGMLFVTIPSGNFIMGSPATEDQRQVTEGPQHEVIIDYSFEVMDTEVTQGMWDEMMSRSSTSFDLSFGQAPEFPMYSVCYYDCIDFIFELNKADHEHIYRLPSESEWEYSCRAGTSTSYYDSLNNIASYALGRSGSHGMVARREPNAWGLYDMSGSACEWCEDDWHDDYTGAPTDGIAWLDAGQRFYKDPKVSRGGSWNMGSQDLRSARRFSSTADSRYYGNGFRVVRTDRVEDQQARYCWSGEDNIIVDQTTGLEWLIGLNEFILFDPLYEPDAYTASSFIQELNSDGAYWRLPTLDELRDLYESELDESVWGPVRTMSWFVWSSETDQNGDHLGLKFFNGNAIGYCTAAGPNVRVFAVR